MYKYLHKGHDRAFIKLSKKDPTSLVYDEISEYLDCRYISPMEVAWRIQELPICERSHAIIKLAVHLENQHNVVFSEDNIDLENLNKETTLTAWFKLNKIDTFA